MNLRPLFSRRAALLGLAAVLLLAFGFVALRSGPLAPIKVTVATVEEGVVTPTLFGIATVEARRAYLIGPTVAGRVATVAVDVGDSVQPGQLLAEIDGVDLESRLLAASAALVRGRNAARASAAQIQDSEARAGLAKANTRRYQDLGHRNFVSTSAIEARRQEQASAEAAVGAAQANAAAAQADVVRLQADHAALLQQRANLRLLAPAAAVVSAREAEPGSTVVAGQAVLRLISADSLWLRLRLDQGRSAGLAVGLPARIALRANPANPLPGKVVRVEKLSDAVTEERVALVAFERIPAEVSVGDLAEISLDLPALPKVLRLPNAAVVTQGEARGVWRVGDGGLRFAPLRLGVSSADGWVEVRDGIAAGDQVVVYRDKAVHADSRIKIVDRLSGSGQ